MEAKNDMKKSTTFIGLTLALAAGIAGTTFAAERSQLKPAGKESAEQAKATRPQVLSKSNITPEPLRSPAGKQKEAGVVRAQEVLVEDFNKIPEGHTETIGNLGERYCDYVASHVFEPGRYIDTSYTPGSGTWEGNFVFAGKNGTVVLQAYNPMQGAALHTPLGDYSGDLTITVRARYAKTFWGADNDLGYVTSKSSDFSVALRKGGYDSNEIPVSDAMYGQLNSGQIYENDGWIDFTFTVRNEGADKDGFLSIGTSSAIEIDYIKVTDAATYLAAPVVREPSNFTDDGFTISWDPVRRSYNYYIDLWKVNYTAESGVDENYDFESGSLPEGTTAPGAEVENGVGMEGSKGLRINTNGVDAAFVTPTYPTTLGSLGFAVYFDVPRDFEISDLDPQWYLGTLLVDGLTEEGWQPIASVPCDGFWTPGGYFFNYSLDGEKFEGRYKALRFYAEGLKAPNSMVLDNIELWGARPYVLERAEGSSNRDRENDDYSYNYYMHTEHGDPCSYTFAGLDPEGEYWYRVRSHNVRDFSGVEKHHALGVAAPALLNATNVGSGSFTANWKDAPKAQNYLLRSYNVTKVAADEEDFSLFNDGFGGCTGPTDLNSMTPLNNATEGYLDQYTDMPGWRGQNNSVGQNLLGSGILTTPALPVNPERGEYQIYIEAYGYPGDTFCIDFLESGLYSYIPVPEEGYISGYLTIPDVKFGERLRFSSLNYMPYALGAFEVTQDVLTGDLIRNLASEVTVSAGIGSYTFTGLSDSEIYAYQPVSQFKFEKETVYSTSTDVMIVDMSTGNSYVADNMEIASDATELARFNTAGVRVGKDYKGLVIIMMSDGTVRKVMVK